MIIASVSKPSTNIKLQKNISSILTKYPNVRYKNNNGYNKLVKLAQEEQLLRYVGSSNFFNGIPNYDKKLENTEHKNIEKLDLENPDKIMSLENEQEFEDYIDNPNSLHGRVMEDRGVGTFRYDIKAPDLVKTMQESNQAFKRKRDMFFIAPQQESISESVSDVLKRFRDEKSQQKKTRRAF